MTDTGWLVKDVTQRLYDSLDPLARPDAALGWPMLTYVNSIGEMLQPAADLCEDGPNGEPGWSIVLDIDRIADEGLDYLGQFIGMHFYTGITAATKRQQIRDRVAWQRGTPASISSAVALFLGLNPPALTLSGNEITDATRAANVQGEGLSFTNLCANGGLETNTTGYVVDTYYAGNATIARDTTQARYGSASLKITPTIPFWMVNCPGTQGYPGQVFIASLWVYADASAVGKQMSLDCLETGTAQVRTTVTLVAGWQRIVSPPLTVATYQLIVPRLLDAASAFGPGTTLYIDGVQLERSSAASDYIETDGAAASTGTAVVTNLCTNGGFETNVNGWNTAINSMTITRDMTRSKYGSASGRFDLTAIANPYCFDMFYGISGATVGRTFTHSIWFYGEGSSVGKTWQVGIQETGGVTGNEASLTIFVVQPGWQRVVHTRTLLRNDRTQVAAYIQWANSGVPVAVGDKLWIDGVQFEENAYASPYVETNGTAVTQILSIPDSSYGLWEATTNIFPNGGAETNITRWGGGPGVTAVRDTAVSKFGSASFRATTAGSVPNEYSQFDLTGLLTPGVCYVASAWIKGPNGVRLYMNLYTGGANIQVPFICDGTWQRISSPVISAVGTGGTIYIATSQTAPAQATTFYIDGLQLEAGPAAPSLVLTGGEITDAVRAANVQGDGRGQDGSMGLWEATTNLCPNGGMETNTTGWTIYGAATIARDTGFAKFGAASLKSVVTTAGGGAGAAYAITALASTVYAWSAWVLAPVAGNFHLGFTDDIDQGLATASVAVPANVWTRLTASGTTDAHTARRLLVLADQACTFYIDGVQIEQRAFATPYVETNGATASRVTASPSITAATAAALGINITQGWFAARVRAGVPYNVVTGQPQAQGLFGWRDDNNHIFALRWNPATVTWELTRVSVPGGTPTTGATKPGSHAVGDTMTLVAKWTGTQLGVSLNGSAFTVVANASIPAETTPLYFSSWGSSANNTWDGEFHWLAMGTGLLTDADALTLHQQGDPGPVSVASMPGSGALLWRADTAVYQTVASEARVVTPYVHTDGASASRAVARVQSPSSNMSSMQGWIAARVRMGIPSTAVVGALRLFSWTADTANFIIVDYAGTGWRLLRILANAGAIKVVNQTFAAGEVVTVIAAWTATGVSLSINGAPFGVPLGNTQIPTLPLTFDIGSAPAFGGSLDGDVLWFAGGVGTLTDTDAATMHGFGNTDPAIASFPSIPAIYWPASTSATQTATPSTKTVQLTERDSSPYHFAVIIWATEAPADTSSLVAYVNQFAKPAGLQWTLTVNPGPPPPLPYSVIYNRGDTYLYDYQTFQRYADIR